MNLRINLRIQKIIFHVVFSALIALIAFGISWLSMFVVGVKAEYFAIMMTTLYLSSVSGDLEKAWKEHFFGDSEKKDK